MSFTGNHGYVNVDGVRLALVKSWDMSEAIGTVASTPGDDGTIVTSINIAAHASAVTSLGLVVGSYVGLDLLEGGAASYFYAMSECRVISIDYSGAAVDQLVERTIQLETVKTKVVSNVI